MAERDDRDRKPRPPHPLPPLPALPTWGMQYEAAISDEHTPDVLVKSIAQVPIRLKAVDPWVADNASLFRIKNCTILGGCKVLPDAWRLWPEWNGSPPRMDALPAMAAAIVENARLFGLRIVELFNEPEVPQEAVSNDDQMFYGAWVRNGNFREMGAYYGAMLKVVYPILHKAGLIVIGPGLNGSDASIEFLKGMVASSSDEHLDAVSFHAYVYAVSEFHRVFDYAARLRKVTRRQVVCTETNLLDGDDLHKSSYWSYVMARIPESIKAMPFVEAFSANGGWRESDMFGTQALEVVRGLR